GEVAGRGEVRRAVVPAAEPGGTDRQAGGLAEWAQQQVVVETEQGGERLVELGAGPSLEQGDVAIIELGDPGFGVLRHCGSGGGRQRSSGPAEEGAAVDPVHTAETRYRPAPWVAMRGENAPLWRPSDVPAQRSATAAAPLTPIDARSVLTSSGASPRLKRAI